MYNEVFFNQVQLLIQCLPSLREQSDFALKGGTAINLFIQDMPRLSVDIDLTFLPLLPRNESIQAIQNALSSLGKSIEKNIPDVNILEKRMQQGNILSKLLIQRNDTLIKIEPNFVLRGSILPIKKASLVKRTCELFSVELSNIPILADEEIYAGKICAALSRQHPRDLFDIHHLLKSNGITERTRQAFIVYLASSSRPIHELLNPNLLDIQNQFTSEFENMTEIPIDATTLKEARLNLINQIKTSLSQPEKEFLLSLKSGEPDYSLLPFKNIDKLPGIQWKLLNIRKMPNQKRASMYQVLKETLYH